MAIAIMLTAANMGPGADKADFDAWADYVREHVNEACGVEVKSVQQFLFVGGPDRDRVYGAADEERAAILGWIAHDGWDAFCSDEAAWPAREEVCA